MTDTRLIRAGGVLTALLTVLHFTIPLGWGDALTPLTRDERATMYELAYGLAVLLAMIAYLSLVHTDGLLTTRLGRATLAWVVVFWLARAAEGLLLDEINAIPIAVMCVMAAVLFGIPLLRSHRRPVHPSPALSDRHEHDAAATSKPRH